MKKKLLNLALLIGWNNVGEENGLISLEYAQKMSDVEMLKHIFQLGAVDSNVEFLDSLGAIIAVLPKKLKKKIYKFTKQSDLDKKDDLVDLISFTIEEYKAQSEFTKLSEYAELLGADLNKLGYNYCYELTKRQRSEILAKIESRLPLEVLPKVGKLKKTDYKIGFIKAKNQFHE